MSEENKPGWCPQDLWDETSSAFDVLYESESDLEGGCEYGIRSMAAAVAMVAVETERERCAKVAMSFVKHGGDHEHGITVNPFANAEHIASAIRSGTAP